MKTVSAKDLAAINKRLRDCEKAVINIGNALMKTDDVLASLIQHLRKDGVLLNQREKKSAKRATRN